MLRLLVLIAALCLPVGMALAQGQPAAGAAGTVEEDTQAARERAHDKRVLQHSVDAMSVFEPQRGMNMDLAEAHIAEFKQLLDKHGTKPFTLEEKALYNAAIVTGDCARAEAVLISALERDNAAFRAIRNDPTVRDLWRSHIGEAHFPESVACSLAAEVRVIDAMLEGLILPPRPFRTFQEHLDAQDGGLYHERNLRLLDLSNMAHRPADAAGATDNYGPAGLLLADLALSLRGIDFADDLVYMMLLRAQANWPEKTEPVPVAKSRIGELIAIVTPRLSAQDRARAAQAWAGNEIDFRVYWGEVPPE